MGWKRSCAAVKEVTSDSAAVSTRIHGEIDAARGGHVGRAIPIAGEGGGGAAWGLGRRGGIDDAAAVMDCLGAESFIAHAAGRDHTCDSSYDAARRGPGVERGPCIFKGGAAE